jgi:hypothetical protein
MENKNKRFKNRGDHIFSEQTTAPASLANSIRNRQVKYLGLILDSKLKWKPHMTAMAALYPLFNRRSPLSVRTRLLLYDTLIDRP